MTESIFDDPKAQFRDLCRELNMDIETEEISWNKYLDVSRRCSLEGNPVEWFCCALFAACRDSYTPTVGGPNLVVIGNCVSLTKLLRCCKISIRDFFSKIKDWQEMAHMSTDFKNQVNRLERTFSITFCIFKRYNTIFDQLFVTSKNEKRLKKCRSAIWSSNQLFEMCWCLYLCAKNQNKNNTLDLVTSFHLLICCIDLIYTNVLAEKRIDLINSDFKGLPKNWTTIEFDYSTIDLYCIINSLCVTNGALPNEAKHMKENVWKAIISEFFKTGTIYGDENLLLGIVSNQNFERNLKSFNTSYEQYVLSVGEIDERILLNISNCRRINNIDAVENYERQDVKSIIPDTPLSGKNSLPANDVKEPVASATNNVMRLQHIADITEPTEFIRRAGEYVLTKLNQKLDLMKEHFVKKFSSDVEAKTRFELAKSLYYYLLDKILKVENMNKPNVDLKQLLETEKLNTTLIACCIEIVLDAYNYSDMMFPWVLKCFHINAFHFYKIIEIVVGRHDGILTRSLIKHLNCVEETCLEALSWKKDSTLWDILKNVDAPIPTWSEVDLDKRNDKKFHSPTNLTCDIIQSSNLARRDLFNSNNEYSSSTSFDSVKTQGGDGNKRVGSLRLFLRKFYKLAWLRMKYLCNDLDIGEERIINKIWTLFEYSITHRTDLMQNRHLDQILMCAIYLYIRVGEIPIKTFTDIMKFYRKQPQATSSTYREVLISEETVEYKDIIYFYNNIYVLKMTPYALNFSENKKSQHDLLISPHPKERQSLPKKLSTNHHVYVHTMEKSGVSQSPNRITYEFCKSPRKDLQDMNEIVRNGKRNLPFNDESDVINRKLIRAAPYYLNTINDIIKDRQTGGT